uniref:(California timema) hypothetical protein n=1 Tax=Timema californicum TaxID=61474 RepID=A0A7R9J959_TIMCA|nr:unnamed protein product [Timema californicum]
MLRAAILQQTAEYVYQLEREKTSLLSQNCHLKRLVNQHEGQQESVPVKKRKIENTNSVVVSMTSLPCESSDEGTGSMSPEPVTIIAATPPALSSHSREMIELRIQLDRERRLRMHLEEQVRTLESQIYPERIREMTQQLQIKLQYQQGVSGLTEKPPVVEHTSQQQQSMSAGGLVSVSILPDTPQLQVVSAASVPPVGQTTTVATAQEEEEEEMMSPCPSPVPIPACPPTPPPQEQRLPSALEAAIKAEPKVEVERLPSPAPDDATPRVGLYPPSTSRQNLETIVEAIRHLEGDHLFQDDPAPLHTHLTHPEPAQEAPLALTTTHHHRPPPVPTTLVKIEPPITTFLQFHHPHTVAALQQQRPGVIVAKHT